MCGRFALGIKTKDVEKLRPGFKIDESGDPRYNIAPSQAVLSVTNMSDFETEYLKWGLVPFWSKEISTGYSLFNIRSESLTSKPAFKNLLERKRALIFADAYYEWMKPKGIKQKFPYAFMMKSREAFTFAALWDIWKNPSGGEIRSCSIITTPANETAGKVHDRMPAIISPEDREYWLAPDKMPADAFREFLVPYPDDEMISFAVTSAVNHASNDSPDCLMPAFELRDDNTPEISPNTLF